MLHCQTCGKPLEVDAQEDTSQFEYRWDGDEFQQRRRRICWVTVSCPEHGNLQTRAIDMSTRAKWRQADPVE